MSRPRKVLGIDTDVWALITPEGQIRAGYYRLCIYWTKARAKFEQRSFPGTTVVPVRIVLQPQRTRTGR